MMRKPRVSRCARGGWHVFGTGAPWECFGTWRAAIGDALAKVRRAEAPC